MKRWTVCTALCALSALPAFATEPQVSSYIVNGTQATVTEYPSFVSLFYDRIEFDRVYGVGSYCGGTLLDNEHVLTAAHCIFDGNGHLDEEYILFTVAGQTDDEAEFPQGNFQRFRGSEFYYHPGYVDSGSRLWPNDLAIIKLESPLNPPDQVHRPADDRYRLGSDGVDNNTNDYVFKIVGHGNTKTGVDSTTLLQSAEMKYVSNSTCGSDLSQLTNKQICFEGAATSADNLDSGTCQGDSGGPVYWDDGGLLIQVGITSFGPEKCGEGFSNSNVDSVFTEIYDYRTWIDAVLAGSVAPDYIATDAKRRDFLAGIPTSPRTSSDSSGGGLGSVTLIILAAVGLWRGRQRAMKRAA